MPEFIKKSVDPYCFRLIAPSAPKLYLSAGIHGNETSGPVCLSELIKEPAFFEGIDVTIFPILNPWGYEHNVRRNLHNRDLNRDFKHMQQAETQKHIKLIEGDYNMVLCLHESRNSDGVFIYKPKKNNRYDIMEDVLLAMSDIMPIDSKHTRGKIKIEPGIIRDVKYKEKHLTEAIYFANKGIDAFTIEVPHNVSMQLRIDTYRAGIKEAISVLKLISVSGYR